MTVDAPLMYKVVSNLKTNAIAPAYCRNVARAAPRHPKLGCICSVRIVVLQASAKDQVSFTRQGRCANSPLSSLARLAVLAHRGAPEQRARTELEVEHMPS